MNSMFGAVLLLSIMSSVSTAQVDDPPLPVGAASPVTQSGKNPFTGAPLSPNGLCSGFTWGGLQTTYWFIPPQDVLAPNDQGNPLASPPIPANPRPLWVARTDLGGWQPILADALVTKDYPFAFIVYAKEPRGTIHVGCFSPGAITALPQAAPKQP